jgi:hypothetical protein
VAIATTENPWDLFPDHRHLATEESGNEIVCDLSPAGGGRVFGMWHDPPAILVLAGSEAEFATAYGPVPTDDSPLELKRGVEDRLLKTLRRADSLPLKEAAGAALGPAFAAWLGELGEDARIADLRQAKPGEGFEFGNFQLARHPDELVIALLPPTKKPGLLGRLFGR